MRLVPVLPVALGAALSVAAPWSAAADSPVVIEGADEDARQAIRDLLPDREQPTSLFDAERIAEEAAQRALAWLRSEGYYAATVTPQATEEPPVARLIVAPGPRFSFAAPNVTIVDNGRGAAAADIAARALAPVRAGAPARAEAVFAAETEAVEALQQAGYADARAADRRVVVDHATNLVSAEFRFSVGEPVRLGGVRAEPPEVFRESFVDSLRNWDVGDPYTPKALARLRRDIVSTGAVSLATTRLAPPGPDGLREVVLTVEPARRHAYEVGIGYSTTEGFALDLEWTRRNLSRRADSLTVAATLAEQLQSIVAEVSRPHAAGLGHTRNFGAALAREDTDAFTRQGVALYASVNAAPRLSFGQSYGVRLSADVFDNAGAGVSNAVVLSGFWDVRRDTTEIRFDPRDGSIVDLRLEPAYSTGDASLAFARAIAEGRIYESFGDDDRLTLAARLRAGWLEALSGDVEDVPPDRRFYAGGGGSVRGYDYNSIYPPERDLLGLTPGGQGLLETSLEARWRFDDRWGATAFVDAGNAFDSWEDAGDLRWGVGVGVRYDLGFAPLRLDIAFPLDDEETSDVYALYISLGQSF